MNNKKRLINLMHSLKQTRDKTADKINVRQEVMKRIYSIPERTPLFFSLRIKPVPALITASILFAICFLFMFYLQSQKYVQVSFTYANPRAHHIAISGDFTDWEPHYMTFNHNENKWQYKIKLQKLKRYKYVFILDDDTYIPDPKSFKVVNDGFGGLNSVISTI